MTKETFVNRELEKRGILLPDAQVWTESESEFCRAWDLELELTETAGQPEEEPLWEPYNGFRPPVGGREPVEEKGWRLYETYMTCPEAPFSQRVEELENELIRCLEKLSAYVVLRRFELLFPDPREQAVNVMSLGDEQALKKLRKERETGKPEPNPLGTYLIIYRRRAIDLMRFYGLCGGRSADAGVYAMRNAVPFSTLATGEDEDYLDHIPELSESPFDEDRELVRLALQKVLVLILQELMDYPKDPNRPLAVMYCRILYQYERLLNPEYVDKALERYLREKGWKNDPEDPHYQEHLRKAVHALQGDAPASNLKWALERMGDMNLREMSEDSEQEVRDGVREDLRWGRPFLLNLVSEAPGFAPKKWGSIIYRDSFTEIQMGHWVRETFDTVAKRAAARIAEDEELVDFLREDISPIEQLEVYVAKKLAKKGGRAG